MLFSRRAKAFTLVELLVVIGIIAVLLSILLPTLGKVRRQAYTLQCSSNMRQIATAMLMYAQDNKGKLPPATIPVIAGTMPNGWWWANELVRLNYVKGGNNNVYKTRPSTTSQKVFNHASVFRCPEGIDEEAGNFGSDQGDYPTDPKNNHYSLPNDSACATDGMGVPSWYQLACRTATGTNAIPGGSRCTPFMAFLSSTTAADLQNPQYQRHMGLVKKASELLMIVEAANNNWYDQTESQKYPGNFMTRLGARHGKKTANGANAFTNFAFFDGHVSLYATEPFEHTHTTPPAANQADNQVREVIFYINKQWKPN